MAPVTVRSDFGAQENKICHYFNFFPFYFHEVMGLDAMILVFLMWRFKPAFSLFSFIFIQRFFYSSSLSALKVVSSAYLRLLIFLLKILILACPAFHITCIEVKKARWQYTALLYSFPNFEPVCCFMSSFNCCFLTHRQVSKETGKVVWYPHFFKNVPQFVVIHTVKGFHIVNEAEVDVFLELLVFSISNITTFTLCLFWSGTGLSVLLISFISFDNILG